LHEVTADRIERIDRSTIIVADFNILSW
jgi:hypothetical protein